MTRPNAKVTIEVTERELAYLMRVSDYPYGNFSQLNSKLGDAVQAMREAKRIRNRANKLARKEREDIE